MDQGPQESIYDLIPREYVAPPKEKRYRSKYPHDAVPTASTFGLGTTSKVVGNMNGDYAHFDGAHKKSAARGTFGGVKGTAVAKTDGFRKKGTGTAVLPEVKKFERGAERKAPVPKATEKPIMGLKSDKNFIVANAVETILAAPKTKPEETKYVSKKDYGQVPKYLNRVKNDIDEEYITLRRLREEEVEEENRQRYLMSPEEVNELREGLRKKWEAVNAQYQSLTHVSKVDTQGLLRRKEGAEKELAQLEKDIAALDKAYIFVDTMA